ncbi:MAG: ATP-binding protein [Desulfovibrio sp.]|nr:ATP-binding protein [Desulfovibrio sp.]
MPKMYARKSRAKAALTSPEQQAPRAEAATWLLRLLDTESIEPDEDFFTLAGWVCGGLKSFIKPLEEAAAGIPRLPALVRNILRELPRLKERRLAERFEEVAEASERLGRDLLEQVRARLAECAARTCESGMTGLIQGFFGLSDEAMTLCKYAFFVRNYNDIYRYFEGRLDMEEYCNRHRLACMLGLSPARCNELIRELSEIGILDEDYDLRLTGKIENAWKGENPDGLMEAFCRSLTGEALPLAQFNIPADTVAHVRSLFDGPAEKPLHVLLYGAPGTGKTTFARSLARELGCKAWAVSCEGDDSAQDRRLALTACLRRAARDDRAFVLVDEAERILDTGRGRHGEAGSDTAWLNPFLEKPGARVLWITNKVSHLEQSVRRRFTYSVHFPELGKGERKAMWRKLREKHGLEARLSEEDLHKLVERYPVQVAIMENALRQAALPAFAGESAFACVDRVLRSYMTLRQDGVAVPPPRSTTGYDLAAVSTTRPVEEVSAQAASLDALLREGPGGRDGLEPGLGTMLFYGPPGTGKTALARHLAESVGRECHIRRASDLLSPYVGETEQNIAAAFARAEVRGAVLVIDEVDSFLQNREAAERSWEVSQTNEFLTALEACRGFCICTTNLRKDMDPAAMRRFSLKVEFCYAGPSQVRALYAAVLQPLVDGEPAAALMDELCREKALAPGDFHAVRMQYRLRPRGSFGHGELVRALLAEQRMKLESTAKRVGFSR